MSQSVDLTIHFEDGRVSVVGPIHDKMFCYGLLGMAHDAIKDWNDNEAKNPSGLIAATPEVKRGLKLD